MYDYKFKVTRVIDGDTIVGDADLGFGVIMKGRVIRLFGIDTPELRSSNEKEKILGQMAKTFVEETVLGKDVILNSIADKKGSFGRILGIIEFPAIGYREEEFEYTLNERLVQEGFAIEYSPKLKSADRKVLIEKLINRAL
jgi:micrococcal nuclease